MSNGTYERVVKLWISVWNLVLENKRHIEPVCAVLQRIVAEKSKTMLFKNWPAICEFGKKDPLVMQIVARLDLSPKSMQKSEHGPRVVALFPECFSDRKVQGPVP